MLYDLYLTLVGNVLKHLFAQKREHHMIIGQTRASCLVFVIIVVKEIIVVEVVDCREVFVKCGQMSIDSTTLVYKLTHC